MKKLTLNVDALRVESFDAGKPLAPQGTVQAHDLIGTNICPSHHRTECCATDRLATYCC